MNAKKITKNILNEMCELEILEYDRLEEGYLITKLFVEKCDEALEYFKENPPLIKDGFDDTLAGILILAYLRMFDQARGDKMKLHVNIIISMLDLWKDKRMEEFSARLRLLERVKT